MNRENRIIPVLRFPEFVKEGEWVENIVSQVADYENGKAHEQDIAEKGKYVVVNSKFISTDGEVRKFSNSANCLAKKDEILMVLSDVPNGKAIAKCFYVDRDNVYTVNQRICKITPTHAHSTILYYLLNRNSYFLSFDDGVKQTNLRNEDVLNCPIILPKNKEEQQKIASCLSSLDELIAAHTDKLEALKVHKKGLMQNLFPQEGQKVPNYRFPEFEKDGEWVEKKLGSIGEPLMCKRIFKDQTTPNSENGVPFYKIGTFGKEADSYIPVEIYGEFKAKYNFPNKGDILISASGTIGRLVIYDGSPAYFQDSNIVWLGHDGKQVTNEFLYYCYSIVNWQTSDGGVIKRLYNSDLKNVSICFPENEKEQLKIALCLSALDKLIAAQSEKIEQLQKHKKGLMQGLFPRIYK